MSRPPTTSIAPAWFEQMMAVPVTDEWISVAGADVHYLGWGERGRPGLVFVHGAGASAHWWAHVAASFADEYRVIAIELSGHGDSQHRRSYSVPTWISEILAATEAAEIDGRPVIIGHSVGGLLTTAAAAAEPERYAGVIVCDARITNRQIPSARQPRIGAAKTYFTLDEAISKFRTAPPQTGDLHYVVAHIARQAAKPVAGGYTWKLDSRVFETIRGDLRNVAWDCLAELRCPLALLRSERGLISDGICAEMIAQTARSAFVIDLPDTGHHAMLDQPLILLTAIRSVLAGWRVAYSAERSAMADNIHSQH